MHFHGAKIREQGVTFAIVAVKPQVLTSLSKENIRTGFVPFFGNIPIGMMCRKDVRQFRSEQFLKQGAGIALQFRGSAGNYPLPKYEETLPAKSHDPLPPKRRGVRQRLY